MLQSQKIKETNNTRHYDYENCQHIENLRRKIISNIQKLMWGTWVAQSVKHLTSAQVMISQSVSSSPVSGSVLTAQSLEPVSDSVSPSLSHPPPFMFCLSLSQK